VSYNTPFLTVKELLNITVKFTADINGPASGLFKIEAPIGAENPSPFQDSY